MNLIKSLTIIMLGLGLCLAGCGDPCDGVACQNGGTCVEGDCNCPEEFIGTNCESINPAKVQSLLDGGQTPFALYNAGVSLEDLYGKMYEGGLIFYVNVSTNTGLIAAPIDQSSGVQWGCNNTDIPNLNNVTTSPPTSGEETALGARIGDGKTIQMQYWLRV